MTSPTAIFLLLIIAAMLHASWNAIIKAAPSGLISIALLNAFSAIVMIPTLLFVELPSTSSLPYLFASVVVHIIYCMTLVASYHFGDLSQVYPIARGCGPLLVALFSSYFLMEALTSNQWIGIVAVCFGIIALSQSNNRASLLNGKAVSFALLTGFLIASYSVIDGLGARLSGSPIGYSALLVILFAIPTYIIALVKHGDEVHKFAKEFSGRCIVAGVMATVGYTIVLLVMTKTHLAYAAAVRETSVIFAALIGSFFLGESVGGRRIIASIVILFGISWIHLR